MPRIEFDGQGVPVPSIALPPFGSDSDLPPTVLTFAENAEFSVTDYKGLGFTHFEVWCVGGAGGRGSDATSQHSFATETVQRPVPQDVWNLRLEEEAINDYYYQLNEIFNGYMSGPVVYNRTYNPGERGYYQVAFQLPQDRPWTAMQAYEAKNPYHLLTFKTTRYAILWPTIEAMGGGGGGGGLHKAVGALTDLADTVSIVVGKAGVDAGYAQTKQPGAWTPVPPPYQRASNTNPYGIRREDIRAYLDAYTNTYPQPQTTFPGNPVKGPDGDMSSFAGSVCQASGGEGGGPGAIWDGAKFVPRGHGGRGGTGGRSAPGGGAAGSTAEGVNGSDGVWLPETGIGSGGGGGKGGRPSEYSGEVIGGGFGDRVEITHLATAGGQGSYSYADTTVYGQRQFRQPWTYMKPSIPIGTSTFIYTPTVDPNNLVIPGGGGGARPFPNMKYGGRGIGFSPNGIVVLRLTKITS